VGPAALSSIQNPVSDFAQTVKQQADIVKVIEGYIRLRKAGAQNYSGLCPFHKEKSPSFSVHAVRQFYHCFGCHESGDVFSFVAKIEKVGFPRRCGLSRKNAAFRCPSASSLPLKRLLERGCGRSCWSCTRRRPHGLKSSCAGPRVLSRASTWLAAASPLKASRPSASVTPRQLQRPARPPQRRGRQRDAARQRPFQLKGAGRRQLRPIYDRFRKRVMFPIASESGRVIAFTARTLETATRQAPSTSTRRRRPLLEGGCPVQSRQGAHGDSSA